MFFRDDAAGWQARGADADELRELPGGSGGGSGADLGAGFGYLAAEVLDNAMDEAVAAANDTEYGLTAGLFSEDQGEIDEWLDRIQAGVVYVNRRAGATTGAWPGVQPFGGWKGSGTTGKAGGGPYYVTQYMREQSRTVIEE